MSFFISSEASRVAGASRYWVFRTDGHAGCEFGKTLIADLPSGTTTYTDTAVAAGPEYNNNVAAGGTSAACFSIAQVFSYTGEAAALAGLPLRIAGDDPETRTAAQPDGTGGKRAHHGCDRSAHGPR